MIQIAMTQPQFDAKRAALKAEEGIELTGMQGSLTKFDVSATYTFDGTALKVLITHKPRLLTQGYCERKLLAWLDAH